RARVEQRAESHVGEDAELTRMRQQIEAAVQTLARRQRRDGGIGYWGIDGWTTPWLSAYAGRVLLEAREAGIAVDDSVLARLAGYLGESLRGRAAYQVPVAQWLDHQANRLAERVAAVDFLSRYGRPELPAENALVAQAGLLRWEDRLLLAQALARPGAAPARARRGAHRGAQGLDRRRGHLGPLLPLARAARGPAARDAAAHRAAAPGGRPAGGDAGGPRPQRCDVVEHAGSRAHRARPRRVRARVAGGGRAGAGEDHRRPPHGARRAARHGERAAGHRRHTAQPRGQERRPHRAAAAPRGERRRAGLLLPHRA